MTIERLTYAQHLDRVFNEHPKTRRDSRKSGVMSLEALAIARYKLGQCGTLTSEPVRRSLERAVKVAEESVEKFEMTFARIVKRAVDHAETPEKFHHRMKTTVAKIRADFISGLRSLR